MTSNKNKNWRNLFGSSSPHKRKKLGGTIFSALMALVLVGFLSVAAFFAVAKFTTAKILTKDMAPMASSQFFDAKGNLITTVDSEEDRIPEDPGDDSNGMSNEVSPASDAEEEPAEARPNDYSFDQHGMRFIAELVRQQNQAQEGIIRAQTEFSNSVMDRMDDYRIQMSKLQSEVAEKEKNRLRADYLAAQDKADEYMEEIHQLRDQLDGANRKAVKLSAKLESLTAENESLRQQVRSLKEQWEEVEKGKSTQQQIFPEMTAYQYLQDFDPVECGERHADP